MIKVTGQRRHPRTFTVTVVVTTDHDLKQLTELAWMHEFPTIAAFLRETVGVSLDADFADRGGVYPHVRCGSWLTDK
jgi:hypothetical protein